LSDHCQLVRHEGNEALFTAIEMSLLSTLAGVPLHLHVEGVRGTGKTTILRAARRWLPDIQQLPGCPYHCVPGRPHCPLHQHAAGQLDQAVESRPMPFLEVSHSAKLGTVVGSIDLARLTDRHRPAAALLPGTLPQAHRGIVLVDEINRLAETAPDLADVFLSVMGTKPGKIQIEETGLPVVELPLNVSVWAASNPDEEPGSLEDVRRQLADRFDLVIPVRRPTDSRVVRSILRHGRDTAVTGLPAGEVASCGLLAERAKRLPSVHLPEAMEEVVARVYIDHSVESLRAVEAWAHASRLAALLADRVEVTIDDLAKVAPLVLRHRVEGPVLSQILRELSARQAPATSEGKPPTGGKDPESRSLPNKRSAAGGGLECPAPGTPWNHLFSRLRDCLSLPSPGKGMNRWGAPPSTPRLSRQLPPAGAAPGAPFQDREGTSKTQAAAALADPEQVAIHAPPLRARPLLSLAEHELVCPAVPR
jgi:magnesium chelatase subunit I